MSDAAAKLRSSGDAARAASNGPPGSPVAACPGGSGWLEVVLLDATSAPLAGQSWVVVDAAGAEHRGKLDGSGLARLENLPPGSCRVKFPELAADDAEGPSDLAPEVFVPGTERTCPTNRRLSLRLASWDVERLDGESDEEEAEEAPDAAPPEPDDEWQLEEYEEPPAEDED